MNCGNESQSVFYGVLLDRFRSLEASHEKLKEEFSVMLQEKYSLDSTDSYDITTGDGCDGARKNSWEVGMEDSGELAADSSWAYISGRFYMGCPYLKVLECMGHAIHISRAGSEEIIYWNRSAEKLYGYKDYEVLGQRDMALIVHEKHHALAGRIMDTLSSGQSWSGQFPFKKRSGETFMAIVTKNQLYEDGQLVGVITVSSDAAVFNNLCPETVREGQDHTDGKSRGINFKKVQWLPRPPIASSVSNLASKVLPRKDGDGEHNGFSNSGEKEQNMQDIPDVTSERPPRPPVTRAGLSKIPSAKNTIAGEGSENEESTSESSSPHKFAQKVLAKLNIRGIGNPSKDKDIICQHKGFDDASFGKQKLVEPSSPEARPATTYCNYPVDAKYNPVPLASNECSHAVRESEQLQRSDSSNSGESTICSFLRSASKSENESNMNAHWGINWEDLQLREEVGQGSFAVVYRGIWNGSDVAVKVFHGNDYGEDTLLGYSKEIDIMRRLRHPNVLLFMGAICSYKKLALVTELLPRGSLYKALHKSNQHLDIRRRLRMALDVARGMNYLHHRNPPIVHRDLKSSNLLVDKSWTVKVGDFGLSKLKEATFLTAKSGRGTPQWMAPEVLRNEPSTEKSDVFSFGVILWELITESIPWNHLNFLQVVGVVGFMDRRLDLPQHLDPKVSSIIRDCWQRAENRPSFEDIIRRLTDIIQTVPGGNAKKSPDMEM